LILIRFGHENDDNFFLGKWVWDDEIRPHSALLSSLIKWYYYVVMYSVRVELYHMLMRCLGLIMSEIKVNIIS